MKKNKGINVTVIATVFVIFAMAMVYGTLYILSHQIDTEKYFQKYNTIVNNELNDLINKQNKMDEKIKDISENGGYTLEEPCILENPYSINPLSALIIFNTKEETSVRLSINDNLVTTIEKSKKHIIPVYGLYANTNNIITLTNDLGETKELNIQTDSLNDYLKGYDVKESIQDKSHLFVLGDLNKPSSYLRGFDINNNLMFYLDFDYVSGANFYRDNFYIAYNSKYSKNTKMQDLKIEMDYLGRILSINNTTDDLTRTPNLSIDEEDYIETSVNLYKNEISNYKTSRLIDTTSVSMSKKIETVSLEKELVDAKIYDKDYEIALNGDYISYEFMEDVTLLMVTKNSNYTYSFELKNKNIIKTDLSGEVSLYVISDGVYYTLLSTLKL